jgi:hypothetical protein
MSKNRIIIEGKTTPIINNFVGIDFANMSKGNMEGTSFVHISGDDLNSKDVAMALTVLIDSVMFYAKDANILNMVISLFREKYKEQKKGDASHEN